LEITNKTAEKYLKKNGYLPNYRNVLVLKDKCELDYDREDYESLDDLMSDAISDLEGQLQK